MTDDTLVHVGMTLLMATVAAIWSGVQKDTGAKIEKAINVVRLDIATLSGEVKAHMREDTAKHEAFDDHFQFTDKRVDSLERRVNR